MQTPYQFFLKHAGYSVAQGETQIQGRRRCAHLLARAEKYARAHMWSFGWEYDPYGCTGCSCGSPECECSTGDMHETLVCCLWDDGATPKVLESLGGICGATREYRRVVEAELALEAMARAEVS
jgi:hypothetical protein